MPRKDQIKELEADREILLRAVGLTEREFDLGRARIELLGEAGLRSVLKDLRR